MHPVPGATVRFAALWAAGRRPACLLAVVLGFVRLGWINPLLSTYTTWSWHAESRGGVVHETNFPELSWIKKLSSSQLLVDWNWALNLRMVETMVRGHKSDRQASLWRRVLWYLRWLLYRQTIILSIRVPFSTLWSLQCLMACFHRTVSGCLHSHHYPTRSLVLINDKLLEYWFVNLQSGAIRCRRQSYMNLTNVGEYALRVEYVFVRM